MRTTKPHVKRWKWGGDNSKWVVDGLRDENGKRVRKFFHARDAANEWLMQRRPELRNQGRSAMGLSDAQRVDAVRALALLAPFSATLTEAAHLFAERAQMLSRTVSFSTLRDELLTAKRADRKSKQYLTDLSHRLATFSRDFGQRQVAGIEAREIDDWLRGLKQSPISRLNFRKVLCTTFEFAMSRGYARENPVLKTAKVKVEHAAPGILRPTEIAELLAAADPKIVPALALAAFAGLRDAEIGRMTWDRVDLVGGYVKVDGAIAKTSSRRLIPISANLRAWLAPYARTEGMVRGAKSVLDPLYREARAKAAENLAKARQPTRGLTDWPHNALRHSFVSYRMALVTNAAQVAEECGHSVQIMKQNYRELVTKAEGEAWFAVMPAHSGGEVLPFAAAPDAGSIAQSSDR